MEQASLKLLLLNPNTTRSLTERMAETAGAVLPAGVVLDTATAPRGFPYISNRSEALVAGAVTLEMLAARPCTPSAAIVAAFGDPGIRAARDLFPFPVIGVAEAAMHSAAMLGDRFAIVAFTQRMRGWYQDCVEEVGLERRFAGFRAPAQSDERLGTVQTDLRDALLECIEACHIHDGADVVITAGAPLAGFADIARGATKPILIDPVVAAVHQAVAIAALRKPYANGLGAWHDPKTSEGLDPALADQFAGKGSDRVADPPTLLRPGGRSGP